MNIQTPEYRYHTLVVTVENKSGVLARVASLFARRPFNIDSAAVAPTDDDQFSRHTLVVDFERPVEWRVGNGSSCRRSPDHPKEKFRFW